MLDLNHGSKCAYFPTNPAALFSESINDHVNAALLLEHLSKPKRQYLGASRIGEPCLRRLTYEATHTPEDPDKEITGKTLRIFEAGHVFEDLSIRWMRAAGFDLRTHKRSGEQYGFETAQGRVRGHIDGVIVEGPNIGLSWPALWEHKALGNKGWTDLVKKGLQVSKPIYWAQVHLYMAYMELNQCLFTALNKDTEELWHEAVVFDPAEAQRQSDKAVDVLRSIDADELPPRFAVHADFYLCRFCPYHDRCWRDA
ncbi:MAG: hypothetical protein AB7S81_00170 [Bdellovibrionales bacterium]